MTRPQHVPVLLDRVVALLEPALGREGAVLVDCTLGLGGHSEAVLERIPTARVIGVDRDPAALELASARLAPYGDRFTGVHAVYDELADVVAGQGLDHVDAVLFDLGVSSMQLDVRERGLRLRTVQHEGARADRVCGLHSGLQSVGERRPRGTRVRALRSAVLLPRTIQRARQ